MRRSVKWFFLVGGILVVLFAAGVYWWGGDDDSDTHGVAEASDAKAPHREACLSCHSGMTGFSDAHHPEKIGCVACHLGDPMAEDLLGAHKEMIVIPGNLSDASMTCSTSNCHAGIDVRVSHSLMNTMSGVVGVNKFVFGEIDTLDGFHNIKDLGDSPADTHLRNLCASCHLGQQKEETGPVHELTRGGGCNACHLNYSEPARKAHEMYVKYQKKILPKVHPSLSLNITNDHCFGCHSRSGRLSTNYEGWHETLLKEKDVIGKKNYRILEDERVFTYVEDDVHHARGMACIDCHGSIDVMGYGMFAHQEEAVQTVCEDCHTNEKPQTVLFDEMNPDDQRMLQLRGFDTDQRFVVGKKSKAPIYNVILNEAEKLVMLGKNSHKEYVLTAPGPDCTRGGVHSDLTCGSCHTSWAPQCISCHTSYNPKGEHYDLLDQKMAKGEWVEKGSHYFSEFPSLGVVDDGSSRKIKTFIPGMVMTLDQSGFTGKKGDVSKHRLFAPTSPHTISAKGQGCKDCHNNPVVLGYGRGALVYSKVGARGKWSFRAQFPISEHDGLPRDAWIGFMQKDTHERNTTRTHARSFTFKEQKNILRVGACLTCHKEHSQVAREMLQDFEKVLSRTTNQCVLPK